MANELNIALAKSGLTVTAQRYQSGAAVGSAISCPETGSTGFYSGNMTGTAGTYQVAFISASANVGSGSIVWDGSAEIVPSTLTQANVQSALTSQGLTSARAGNLENLDTTVSSRLAPSGTLATVTTLTNSPNVPSAAAIASQVRTELATELARVDAAVSTRLASSAYTAASTAVQNAAAVRTELATELARVDVATSTRLATSGYTAPSAAPTAAQNASAVRTELGTELSRIDATTSSRLASSAYSAAPTTAQIATAVEGSLLNEADGQAVLNAIVGAIGNTNLSEVSLVAAVRADLERVGGKIDSIPTTAAPTAAANATAVWSAATKEITGGTVTTLTNSPSVPSAASIASATRTELAVELARVDAAVSTRLASSAYTAPANSDITAIKAKTDLLNPDRLANVATTAIVGNLIAQANS